MSNTKGALVKTQKAKEIKPKRKRLFVRGVRTCSRIAPSQTTSGTPMREDKIYGPVLHAGKPNRGLCREYLKRWLMDKEDYHPIKGAKAKNACRFERLLLDFGKDVNLDNGRSCKVFKDFVRNELRLLYRT